MKTKTKHREKLDNLSPITKERRAWVATAKRATLAAAKRGQHSTPWPKTIPYNDLTVTMIVSELGVRVQFVPWKRVPGEAMRARPMLESTFIVWGPE